MDIIIVSLLLWKNIEKIVFEVTGIIPDKYASSYIQYSSGNIAERVGLLFSDLFVYLQNQKSGVIPFAILLVALLVFIWKNDCHWLVKTIGAIAELCAFSFMQVITMVYGVTKEVTKLGLSLIEEEQESYDELLCKRQDLRKGWYVERRDETKLLTSLSEICYNRTYFRNKETGEYCYLLDRLMGLEAHARISEDAESRILEEAVESSYRKGGINACIGEQEDGKTAHILPE